MPPSVNMVIDSLHAKGFEAYAVGGCVRDTILAREPDDWDITTSASPQQVKEIFDRTVDTGLEHGTVTVLAGSGAHEVTTYRIDGEYEDGRHPKEVVFTSSLAEDLRRRDFTINAMAYNNEEGLVDLFDGIRDLQRKVIRCVGNPTERFSEDALRILRALRFSAQLGFKLDPATLDAIIALAPTLEKISAERIRVELNKLLISKRPEYMEAVYEAGITKIVLPEFDELMKTPQNNPHHCYNVGEHTIAALQHVPADPILRWTMLLHDIAKPACRTTDEAGINHFKGHAPAGEKMAKAILRRLKFDNETIRQVAALIRWHDCRMAPEKPVIRRILNKLGPELFEKLMIVQEADTMAKSLYQREETLERIGKVRECVREILDNGDCFTLKMLAVSGKDLMELGVPKGPKIGECLNAALEEVMKDPAKNTKEYLTEYVKTLLYSQNGKQESRGQNNPSPALFCFLLVLYVQITQQIRIPAEHMGNAVQFALLGDGAPQLFIAVQPPFEISGECKTVFFLRQSALGKKGSAQERQQAVQHFQAVCGEQVRIDHRTVLRADGAGFLVQNGAERVD